MLKERSKEEKDYKDIWNFFFFFFWSQMENSDAQSSCIWVGQRGAEEQG